MSFNVLELYDCVPIVTCELANKIGPTPADVARPPDSRPDDYFEMGMR